MADKTRQKTEHRRELLRKIEYKVVICMHSCNASQHFKTVKALHWLSHLKERFPWLRTVRWCFGCPGHGKGPWDGIGAVIKSQLRLAITDKQCANTAGKISTAGTPLSTPDIESVRALSPRVGHLQRSATAADQCA